MEQILLRLARRTPKFFRKLRNIGLTLAAIGTAIMAAQIELPAIVVELAKYLIVTGSIMSGVCQATVMREKE